MARARNIKPSLFKNEILGTADPLLTILFESLWCLADRDGILEDRPLRIKAETFPYRELDINGYLTELQRLGFIWRYKDGETALIQVCKFAEHQHPHNTEKPSVYRSFATVKSLTVKEPLNNGYATSDSLNTETLNTDSLQTEILDASAYAGTCMAELCKRVGVKKLPNHVEWVRVAEWAFGNGNSLDEFLECYDLMAGQKWRGGAIKPKTFSENLAQLDRLRNAVEKENGTNQKSSANHYRLADELERQGLAEREAERRLLGSGDTHNHESDFPS